ncbi:MAG: HAD family hydrolase [Elusimicrobia bacterium]|nr:HAD family hydrolase [Elusimicrobiota bacterium]
MNRAVFLDRDGVIVEEVNYLCDPRELKLLPGAAKAIARLRKAGFKVIVVSNQSGVARGFLSLARLEQIHRRLESLLHKQGAGLDAVYFCPHHPEFGRRQACLCRKPGTEMLEKAAKKFDLEMKSCYLVGDTTTDMRAAYNAGCKGLLVHTGHAGRDGAYRIKPHATFRDLASAALWILSEK